jgi:hypothetical protein
MHSEARLFVNAVVIALGVGVLVSVCVLSWIKGRRAERFGAALYGGSVIVTFLFEIATGGPPPIAVELGFDTLVAIGFLMLAIGYNNLWLGAAMIIKGVQLAVHATHLTDVNDPYFAGFNLYAASLNLISLLILLTILGGTVASIRSRRTDAARQNVAVSDGAAQRDSA